MSPGEVFLLVIRWAHGIAAVAWVGGSLFYLFVLRPAIRREGSGVTSLSARVGHEFHALVDTAILILILTGVVMTFDRLTSRYTDAVYVSTLGVKVALSIWMFALAHSRLRRGSSLLFTDPQPAAEAEIRTAQPLGRLRTALTSVNLLVVLGVIVFFLSDLLSVLFEQALEP